VLIVHLDVILACVGEPNFVFDDICQGITDSHRSSYGLLS